MLVDEIYYEELLDSEGEIGKLDEAFAEGLELQREKMMSDAYDPNTDGRKDLEELFERRLYLQFAAAKTFHPFSEFGGYCLEHAQELIDEYESEVGPVNTRITKSNIDRFKGSLTEDLMDDIKSGKCQAIGALRYDGDGISGVGALVYEMDTDRLGEEYILRIRWIFVKEAFRKRGVATSLLGSILCKSRALGTENILFESSTDHKWNQAYYNLLSGWHFDLEVGLSPRLYLRLSDVEVMDEMLEFATPIRPLMNLSMDQRKEMFEEVAGSDEQLFGLFSRQIPDDYFDGELSGILEKDKKVYGMILAHRMPSGMIRMEYCGGEQNFGAGLFSYMIITAKEICDKDTIIELVPQSEEMNDFFDTYFSEHLRLSVVMASLQKPYGTSDTGVADAVTILNSLPPKV